MIAILGGLGAACCWATTALCVQTASKKVGELNAFAWTSVIGFLLVSAPFGVSLATEPASARTLALLALAGVMNVATLLMVFFALRSGQVSVVIPITSAEGAVAAIVAAILGKPLSAPAWAALAVVLVGVAIVALSDPKTLESDRRAGRRSVWLAVLAAVFGGVGLCLQGRAGHGSALGIVVAPPTIMGLLLVVVPMTGRGKLRSPRAALGPLVAVAVVELLGFVCYVYGARDSVPVAAVLSAQYATIAVLSSVVVLGERMTRGQVIGYLAIGVGVAGVALIH